MRHFIFSAITIVVFVALLSILGEAVSVKFEGIEHTEVLEHTATKDIAGAEYLELNYDYVAINYITVNAVALDLETDIIEAFSDNDTIVILANVSIIGDTIIIEYTYLVDTPIETFSSSVQTLIDLIPLVAVAGLIITIAVIRLKPKNA